MKFSVSYSRKVKAGRTYEMLEIGASVEQDTSVQNMRQAFEELRDEVNKWIEAEQDRLLESSVKRPAIEKEAD